MKIFWFLFSGFVYPCSLHAAASPPDFTVKVGQEQETKPLVWLLLFSPPEHHHFNIQAPINVVSQGVPFQKAQASETQVSFRASDPKLKEGEQVHASLFLCDDAKTYCVKKVLNFPLRVNSELRQLPGLPQSKPSNSGPVKKKSSASKDKEGFWDNNEAAALSEAAQDHKPLLIDFYGIWCPPCNLFNETVFPKAKFKAAAKKWVLLKMDADAAPSFALKAHFKIGGYPTLVAAKAPEGALDISNLQEIDRIVGYYPEAEFVEKMNALYLSRNQTLAQKLSTEKETLAQTLKQLIDVKLEQKSKAEALSLAEEGIALFPKDHFFALQSLTLRSEDQPKLLSEATSKALVKAVLENREHESSETLLKLEELLVSHSESIPRAELSSALDLLGSLSLRVNRETLSVPGVELSIADLSSLKVDIAEALKDEALLKTAYTEGISSYQKLIAINHGEESRGLSLELAYLYWKNGNLKEAKSLYSHFIAKYPKEFTFYFAASRMYLDLKELGQAREYAENAVKYAYGDNQIRAMERLIRVMNAQGEKSQAITRGKEFLKANPPMAPDQVIRTNRYLQALQKAIDEAGKV